MTVIAPVCVWINPAVVAFPVKVTPVLFEVPVPPVPSKIILPEPVVSNLLLSIKIPVPFAFVPVALLTPVILKLPVPVVRMIAPRIMSTPSLPVPVEILAVPFKLISPSTDSTVPAPITIPRLPLEPVPLMPVIVI